MQLNIIQITGGVIFSLTKLTLWAVPKVSFTLFSIIKIQKKAFSTQNMSQITRLFEHHIRMIAK